MYVVAGAAGMPIAAEEARMLVGKALAVWDLYLESLVVKLRWRDNQ